MSGEANRLSEAAQLVAASADLRADFLLRELVGDLGGYREEDVGDASSELSDLARGAEEEAEEVKRKESGRPNFHFDNLESSCSTQEFASQGVVGSGQLSPC